MLFELELYANLMFVNTASACQKLSEEFESERVLLHLPGEGSGDTDIFW